MKLVRFAILSFLISLPAFSITKITSQIHEVDLGSKMGDEVLVFLKSGDVVRLNHWDLAKVENLQSSKSDDLWITFSVDHKRVVKKIEAATVTSPAPSLKSAKFLDELNEVYTPTTIASMKVASEYIAESRHVTKEETQCFNRALVWTYEWWKKHSLKSNKIFVFWPKEYVRKYGFKWWFHVSPYVHVMDNDGVVKERVMDVKWLKRPYGFQEWANYHSVKDVPCRVVDKYSDYADHPFDTDRCYFIRTNMYTWQPADLEMFEAWGYKKEAFNMDEVRAAYLEAFDIQL